MLQALKLLGVFVCSTLADDVFQCHVHVTDGNNATIPDVVNCTESTDHCYYAYYYDWLSSPTGNYTIRNCGSCSADAVRFHHGNGKQLLQCYECSEAKCNSMENLHAESPPSMIEMEDSSHHQNSTSFLDSAWGVLQSAFGGNTHCFQSYAYASTNMSMVEVIETSKCPLFTYECHTVRFKDHLQLPDGEWKKSHTKGIILKLPVVQPRMRCYEYLAHPIPRP
ncbi:hypothetical protein AAVH_26375 [Aphelenchoides avenae]|nr:hypothetical protein AAVH_26375 [Aphelenchus avenae]